ncbi:MAG TPA: adenosine-specific kinase [Candidatus Cloacimonadota bacterium]|jgi:adenosine/AMP kinase|nr:adenosine-specific kinase [Candidatus Cloacimonadota bacterium]HQB40646.1 adenosine-specific kinase [Candidatus Cloacimonadota bacterium]
MEIIIENINYPEGANIIYGQSHFIKTVEDLYEAMINSAPNAKFGLAFNEASGPCLIRKDGNDNELTDLAAQIQKKLGAGHTFIIIMQNCFPIQVLPAIKECREVVNIFCATGNPVQVVMAQTEQGRGVLGVIDGNSPKGIELDSDIFNRKNFLINIGYKR